MSQAEVARPKPRRKKIKLIAVIHPEGCTGCEVCIEFCPVDCIYKVPGPEYEKGENSFVGVNGICVVDEDICIGCRLCAKYCPWETIEMVRKDS